MERPRLPLLSLLSLFGALLMLSPEPLLGSPGSFVDVPMTDPKVLESLAYCVRKYNQKKSDSANYFKVLQVLKAQLKMENGGRRQYRIKAELVETICEKKIFEMPKRYEKIQECQQLPGNHKKVKVNFTLYHSN